MYFKFWIVQKFQMEMHLWLVKFCHYLLTIYEINFFYVNVKSSKFLIFYFNSNFVINTEYNKMSKYVKLFMKSCAQRSTPNKRNFNSEKCWAVWFPLSIYQDNKK